jgi:hypothetical protein
MKNSVLQQITLSVIALISVNTTLEAHAQSKVEVRSVNRVLCQNKITRVVVE